MPMDGYQLVPQRPWWRPPLGVVLLAIIVLGLIGFVVWKVVG
ncbi:unannotated protein [freshwater metagenome]|uniref:Unannotated protein n=1 Tax=freshwater metagenome TaxID=449393 RepID=A0A6J7DSI7_9ZZZZ